MVGLFSILPEVIALSTAAAATQEPTESKTVLPFTSAAKAALERILDGLAALEPQIVAELELQDEKEILKIRAYGKQLEHHSWVITCACDAALWNKTAAAKRGRGHKDVSQIGILSAVSKRSKIIGVTPRTVYRNAQVFRLMQTAKENVVLENNVLRVLDEYGYYDQALNAANPVEALNIFAEKKLTEKRFRVTDAERLLTSESMTRKAVGMRAVEQVRQDTGKLSARQALVAHIREAQHIVRTQIVIGCPDADFKIRVWDELLLELDEQYQELFDDDAADALKAEWNKGSHREDQLAAATGFPAADVSRIMNALADLSEFIRIQPRNVKSRSEFQLWHKVGQPFDNARFMPMARRE